MTVHIGGASQHPGLPDDEPRPQEVVVTDVAMPFWSMVTFMVKWAIASIPAFLILLVLSALVAGFFRALLTR